MQHAAAGEGRSGQSGSLDPENNRLALGQVDCQRLEYGTKAGNFENEWEWNPKAFAACCSESKFSPTDTGIVFVCCFICSFCACLSCDINRQN